MPQLILLRHGESVWNQKNIFTGWVDIPLSPKGVEEALQAGDKMCHVPLDICYTSTLVRAMMTLMLALSKHDRVPAVVHPEEWYAFPKEADLIPVHTNWRLNERMYGELQGKDKQRMRDEYGDEQVLLWRRSFDVPPPDGESLKLTADRTLPFFKEHIIPDMNKGKNVLIAAHGNSIRSIVMELDKLSQQEVISLEIPTGDPLFYNYIEGRFEKVL